MQRRFFISDSDLKGILLLSDGDVHHIKTVLRLRPGDHITVCNGQGWEADCRLDDNLRPIAEKIVPSIGEPGSKISLYSSISKGERFEWLLQKAVELGVAQITPVISERCIVPFPEEKKIERWAKIIKSAAEQSRRGRIPRLCKPLLLPQAAKEAEGLRIFCYEEEKEQTLYGILHRNNTDSISIFTGPEGGYTPEEAALCKAQGWMPVSLGERILRSETAPLLVLSAVIYERMGLV